MKPLTTSCVLLALVAAGFALADPPKEESAKPRRAAAKRTHAAKAGKGTVSVHVFDREGKLVGPVGSPKVSYSLAEWKRRLTPEQFKILRSKGTEQPFCGTLLDNKQEGVYTCVGCGLP